ncbi:MAG: CvpA family protein [Lachnospiraceae bacterium]|nr:CvpA family protein [Lachnospiraceae bacterium]
MKSRKLTGSLWRILISAIIIFILFYLELPPLNPRSEHFWSFLFQCVVVLLIINGFGVIKDILTTLHVDGIHGVGGLNLKETSKPFLLGALLLIAIIVIQFAGGIIGHPFFHSGAYAGLIEVEDGDFAADVAELSMNQIPVVDKDSAQRLGNRKLGEMSDLVSQFEIMDMYTQINYQGTPYRVTPLQYGDMIKWFTNRSQGIPAYVMVNMVTQETSLKRLDEGMKYSPSEYFFRNINRHLRFAHPTLIFDFEDISFEINEEGTPFWVAPVISYRIGLWSGKDVSGVVLVNAITGEDQYYELEDIPAWVDQVFISSLIVNQLDYYGMYQNGYINSMFGQKGVRQTTAGYNYIAIGDDVYLYTGVTSVTSDESNIGFMLVNLRTKEAKYYTVPGATEASAMASAQGQVQQMNYTATFPLLLNISDRPTYFMSLKDAAGLVKMYAFVDVEQYQVVGTGTTVKAAMANYATALGVENGEIAPDSTQNSGSEENSAQEETEALIPEASVSGTISAVSSAVVGGNTRYYFLLDGDENIYTASITLDASLPFLKAGDSVTFEYAATGTTRTICSMEKQ